MSKASSDASGIGEIMISTQNLSELPNIDDLIRLMKSLAMLEAILCPDWESRYYSFNSKWSKNAQMGSMRNGCGDDYFAHFSDQGCWIKGFAHESPMTPYLHRPKRIWRGIYDSVPDAFEECLKEPAFSVDDVTFCIWRQPVDTSWRMGSIEFPEKVNDPDGSERLLSILDGDPESYHSWASEYYGRNVDVKSVSHVYKHKNLTKKLVELLNPEMSLEVLSSDIQEIGYPHAT